ncbi:MAG: FAD binding domain-containing protein, partial [Terriglobia bacterium]
MSLPSFDLVRPRSLGQAVEALAAHGEGAMVLAGGTDLVPNLQAGVAAPRALVDIKGIEELRGFRFDRDGGLEIGALTTLTEIAESRDIQERYAVLAQAAHTVASPVLRNMGTLGGNLCLDTRCLWYNQSHFWRQSCGFCLKKDGTV